MVAFAVDSVGNCKPRVSFQPAHDFCLIEPVERNVTPGGIALPKDADDGNGDMGCVVAVGPGFYDSGIFITPTVKVGDLVYMLTPVYSPPIPLRIDGKQYAVVRARDIIGVRTK